MSFVKPFHYYSPEVFSEELARIFSSQWLFAGMIDDVAEPCDYRVVEFVGKSVVIYNSDGDLKAFQNICSQKFNTIFTEPKGNASLKCQHHSSADNQDVCLKEYKLAVVGKLVFINFSANPIAIEDQLGELEEEIISISEVLDEKIYERSIPHKSNWKFMVENVIETEHCKAIHMETFGKVGGCVMLPDIERKVKHNSFFIIPPVENEETLKRDKFMRKFLPRKFDTNKYKHILFFPNLTIFILDGYNIVIGQLLPIDADNTIYTLRFYTSELIDPKPVAAAIQNQMKETTISFVNQLFAEDIVFLENLQRGVKQIEHSGFVYESEARLKWFFESYEEFMKPETVA